jgi:hypothetical protein
MLPPLWWLMAHAIELTSCLDNGTFFSGILWTPAEAVPAAMAVARNVVPFIIVVVSV